MLTLVPLPGSHGAGTAIAGGMGVYSDQASRRGRNYGHGGGGPGYDLDVTLFSDTPIGRVSSAVFVSSSVGHRARDINAALLAQLLDGASPIAGR